MEKNNFNIADLDVQIAFRDTAVNGKQLLHSLEPFRTGRPSGNCSSG